MSKLVDLTGKQFDRLTVIKRVPDYIQSNGRKRTMWLCMCECGNYITVDGEHLKSGATKSCGCLQRELTSKRFKRYNKYNLDNEYGIGYTSQGKEFWFDIEDYERIKQYCWYIDKNGYVIAHDIINPQKILILSRVVMNLYDDTLCVDHIHGEQTRHDNRKCNLRICTKQQNNINRRPQSNSLSGITGVRWNQSTNKWIANISINGTYMSKSFSKFEDAVKQRQEWENEIFGEYSYSNSQAH